MYQDRFERLQAAVDDIARFDDRQRLSRSPFHLSACGGCGAPAFKQPCSMCGHYPFGTDRGTRAPATFEAFAKMIERSGPNKQDGTIATWHARSLFETALWSHDPSREQASEEAAIAASSLDVPSPEEVWSVIVTDTSAVTRSPAPTYVSGGWRGLSEINSVALGHYRSEPVREATQVKALIQRWIESSEADDAVGMRTCLADGITLASDVNEATRRRHSGNIHFAIDALSEAFEAIPDPAPAPRPFAP